LAPPRSRDLVFARRLVDAIESRRDQRLHAHVGVDDAAQAARGDLGKLPGFAVLARAGLAVAGHLERLLQVFPDGDKLGQAAVSRARRGPRPIEQPRDPDQVANGLSWEGASGHGVRVIGVRPASTGGLLALLVLLLFGNARG
jgi:hypothetical protein